MIVRVWGLVKKRASLALAGSLLLAGFACIPVSISEENRMTQPAHLLITDWTPSYKLYGQPHAIWLDASERVGANEARLQETLRKAKAKKQYPEIVVYAIPLRDLGQSSEGGFANYDEYWKDNELNADRIRAFVKETGLAPRIYLEPDALSLSVQYRVDNNNNAESMRIYADRINIFRKLIPLYRGAGALVYLEAGHSGWFDYADENVDRIATALNEAGIDQAHGLATNVSNRQPISDGARTPPIGRKKRAPLPSAPPAPAQQQEAGCGRRQQQERRQDPCTPVFSCAQRHADRQRNNRRDGTGIPPGGALATGKHRRYPDNAVSRQAKIPESPAGEGEIHVRRRQRASHRHGWMPWGMFSSARDPRTTRPPTWPA